MERAPHALRAPGLRSIGTTVVEGGCKRASALAALRLRSALYVL
jgi:hypothetical protein